MAQITPMGKTIPPEPRTDTARATGAAVPFLFFLCVICGSFFVGLTPAAAPEPWADGERDRRGEQVRPGLSPDQVRDLLGPPQRVARQILYQRYLEQWVYDAPFDLRVEFECRRGQQPQVQSVQPLRPARP